MSGWALAPHVCRQCLGRVLEQDGEFLCSSCGLSCKGEAWGICACGLRANSPVAKRAGFRCIPNPAPTPAAPAQIVVVFDANPAALHP